MSAGLDFETKIMVKKNAPQLLRKELNSRKWQAQVLGVCGVTDAYQPIERHLKLTRQCLEVLADFRNPAWVVTKNRLVTRDIDVLQRMAEHRCVAVAISVTTLDAELANVMEPRATAPAGRLDSIRQLSAAGIPTTALVAPVIPGLTDHEMPAILAAVRDAGALYAGYVMLRLPHGIGDLFTNWLEQHYPLKKDKIIGRLKDVRGGKIYDSEFSQRMSGTGVFAEAVRRVYDVSCKKLGFPGRPEVSTNAFRRPGETQPRLFDE
jgi:DNA repair photolyase